MGWRHMETPLTSYLSRYRKNADALARTLGVPVLLVDPFEEEEQPDASLSDAHRLRTVSAVGGALMLSGEPVVLELRKQKENAFPRGVTVGRTRNNDLVLDHSSISRFHGWFEWNKEKRQWRLVDAGSKNGTYLEGVRLAAKQPVDLPEEVRLGFGQVRARLLSPSAFLALLARRAQDVNRSP
jgi:hypothetical protein